MTTGQTLLAKSSLPSPNTALNHFLSITAGTVVADDIVGSLFKKTAAANMELPESAKGSLISSVAVGDVQQTEVIVGGVNKKTIR